MQSFNLAAEASFFANIAQGATWLTAAQAASFPIAYVMARFEDPLFADQYAKAERMYLMLLRVKAFNASELSLTNMFEIVSTSSKDADKARAATAIARITSILGASVLKHREQITRISEEEMRSRQAKQDAQAKDESARRNRNLDFEKFERMEKAKGNKGEGGAPPA